MTPENPAGGFDVNPFIEGTQWDPLRAVFGLAPDQWERLTQVVTLHLTLDAYLLVILTRRLRAPLKPGEDHTAANRLHKYLGRLTFAARLDLAKAAGWIDEDVASDLQAVNTLRNNLLHFKSSEDVGTRAPEIATAEAFQVFLRRGLRAYRSVGKIVHP
jgi:hypothetical protein